MTSISYSFLFLLKVIRKKGKFHKTFAIQDAVATIDDLDAIVLQTDLHLEFPLNFIDDVRKVKSLISHMIFCVSGYACKNKEGFPVIVETIRSELASTRYLAEQSSHGCDN